MRTIKEILKAQNPHPRRGTLRLQRRFVLRKRCVDGVVNFGFIYVVQRYNDSFLGEYWDDNISFYSLYDTEHRSYKDFWSALDYVKENQWYGSSEAL